MGKEIFIEKEKGKTQNKYAVPFPRIQMTKRESMKSTKDINGMPPTACIQSYKDCNIESFFFLIGNCNTESLITKLGR